ncbi:hypothetical protein PaeBR_03140 [Paenibacillus sp. BR2-3]|uniref:hypothetical protein n=1 Tax=Paenibacillus sp. BR2-3 TaxID=3048494 RepID=UPI003977B3FC
MSFFGKLFNNIKDTAERQQADYARRAQNATGSAINSGRMRETDIIKGKDSPLPKEPGMYRHINKETGNVEYAGQTDNLRKRQQEHARDGKLNTQTQRVQYATAKTDATKDDLCQTEKVHIARHKPSGNTYKGGNGRR